MRKSSVQSPSAELVSKKKLTGGVAEKFENELQRMASPRETARTKIDRLKRAAA